MKIALSNPFWWLTFSFLYFSCCFPKEPEQEIREGCAGSWGAWKVQGPSGHQAKHHGPTNPTCCCLVWATKYSLRHPSAGQCMPTCADQPEAGQPLHWREHKTSHPSKKNPSLSELYLRAGYCFLSVRLEGTDELSCQQWHCDLFEDVLYLWRIYFTGEVFQWKYALYRPDTRQLL